MKAFLKNEAIIGAVMSATFLVVGLITHRIAAMIWLSAATMVLAALGLVGLALLRAKRVPDKELSPSWRRGFLALASAVAIAGLIFLIAI